MPYHLWSHQIKLRMSKIDLLVKVKDWFPTSEIEGYLVTTDTQKAFDSVNHSFLLTVLKAFDFGKDILHCIEILLTNQASCVLNGSTITKYFKLKKGMTQGDSTCAYFPFLVLEIIFLMIEANQNISH